jgi:hypothetical protein
VFGADSADATGEVASEVMSTAAMGSPCCVQSPWWFNEPSLSVTPLTCQEIAINQHGDLVLLAHHVTIHRNETPRGEETRGP